ncbi:MAG TPA: GNAT family N-acetyltransferase [Mycobacteriales bacterium]|nr:GNAT family N-acetyltransferase [Mycobacteriales bacterium]
MPIRRYTESDRPAVAGLLDSATGGDPVRRLLWDLHGPARQAPARCTLVAERRGELVGVGSVSHGRRHPRRVFTTVHVAPGHRRHGIATALLDALRPPARGLPFRVRTRADDADGLGFLAARGFRLALRCRTGLLGRPAEAAEAVEAVDAAERLAGGCSAEPAEAGPELAALFTRWYANTHRWDPPARWEPDDALAEFCGPDVLPGAAWQVRDAAGRLAGAATLLAGALLPGACDLAHIAALPVGRDGAVPIVARLAARALRHAAGLGRPVAVEVDEPSAAFWTVAHTLPVRWDPDTLIHVTDAPGAIQRRQPQPRRWF